jgi:hypothetical protein
VAQDLSQAQPAEREEYVPPALVVIGSVEEFTLATKGSKFDGTKPKP